MELNEEDRVAGTIRSFDAVANKRMNICVRREQIRGLQHPLFAVDPMHARELEVSFFSNKVDHCRGFMYNIAAKPVIDWYDTFDSLETE